MTKCSIMTGWAHQMRPVKLVWNNLSHICRGTIHLVRYELSTQKLSRLCRYSRFTKRSFIHHLSRKL